MCSADRELEIQIKLTVNEKLYEQKVISEEIYLKAKTLILKGQ